MKTAGENSSTTTIGDNARWGQLTAAARFANGDELLNVHKDFNLPRDGNIARNRSATVLYLSSDSCEEYITVDGNRGDRYVLVEGLQSQRTLILDFVLLFGRYNSTA